MPGAYDHNFDEVLQMELPHEIKHVRLTDLKPHPKNPRMHPEKLIKKLMQSIGEFGFTNPILVDADNRILAGHARWKAAEKMGFDAVPALVLPLKGAAADAYVIVDNRLNELSSWDENLLAEMIIDIDAANFDVSLTGFDAADVDALLNKYYSKEAVQDEFDIDKAKAEVEEKGPITKRGDIWLLGNHRLLCGDATSEMDMARLMDGAHAQMAVTSPPYGVGKEYEKAGIDPWFETMRPAIANICKHADVVCWQMIDLYCTGSQFIEPTGFYSAQMFAERGFRPIWIRIWKKQGINFGVGPYHLVSNKPAQQYEYITTFAGQETEQYNDQEFVWLSAFAGHSYKFVKRLTKEERKKWGYAGIWEINTVRANKEHPAMFPVELPWRCVKMHSDRGGVVLEPFSGSGTTIIACEQTERMCYAMELSPVFCDLAVKRWETFTEETAVRMEAGE